MEREDRIALAVAIRQRTRQTFGFHVDDLRIAVAGESNHLAFREVLARLDPDVVLDQSFGLRVRATTAEEPRRHAEIVLERQRLENLHRALGWRFAEVQVRHLRASSGFCS
jgi:hypothetical protein